MFFVVLKRTGRRCFIPISARAKRVDRVENSNRAKCVRRSDRVEHVRRAGHIWLLRQKCTYVLLLPPSLSFPN